MRIPGVQDGQGSLIARIAFWRCRRVWGRVLEPLRLYALVPRLMTAFGRLVRAAEKPRKLPVRVRSLVMARTAALVGCPF